MEWGGGWARWSLFTPQRFTPPRRGGRAIHNPAIHSVHILVFTRGASPPVCTPPDAPHRMGTHRMCASTPPCLSSQDPSIGIHPGSIQRVRCTSTRPSHERVPSPSHQHRSSAPFISACHQRLSSALAISACHQRWSSVPPRMRIRLGEDLITCR